MNSADARKLTAVLDACPVAALVLDDAGVVQYANAAAERLLGWGAAELAGKPFPAGETAGQWAGAAGPGESSLAVRRSDGSPLRVRVDQAPWPVKSVKGVLLFLSADSASSNLPLTSGDSDSRFGELLEVAPDAILEVDGDGRIVLLNAVTEKLFGYGREELLGESVDLLIPGNLRGRHLQHRERYFQHPGTRPMGSGLSLWAVRKDGTEFPVEISLSPGKVGESMRVVAIIRDVTERRRAEEQIKSMHQRFTEELTETNRQLEQRNREVERANRLKSEFMASMSHELRTPLHTVIGFAELLGEESQGPLNEKQKRYVRHIHRDSQHLLELINDILDLSRIEAGRLDLHSEEFGVRPAVEEVVSSIGALAGVKAIEVAVQLAGQLMVFADRLRFKEVLMNLLSNAVKFTPNGGRVTVSAAGQGRFVEFAVSDTGIGIAPEEHQAIFDTFYQVGSTTKGVREGTGLGLTICQHLVEKQGGRIWVESALGRGSTFHFTLPVQGGAEQPAEPEPAPPLVLVAEPDESSRELLISHLTMQGYRTETSLTAPDTLRLARELKPDAIALDLTLATGGWSTLQTLLRAPETAGIPVVVISSQDETKSAIALGAAAYLVKPVKKEVFLDALRRHITPLPGHSTRVLAVDDDPECRQLLQEMLSNAGYTTLVAPGGREALEILARTQVDVAIIDLVMPEMNGFELILRIKESPRLESLPVLVLTGRDLTEQDYDVLQRKAKAVFLKSSSWRNELLRRLDSILRPVRR